MSATDQRYNTTYRVTWVIDVETTDHKAAAKAALAIQRNNDPGNLATHFAVAEVCPNGELCAPCLIDLGNA